jgi:hypothetical protein
MKQHWTCILAALDDVLVGWRGLAVATIAVAAVVVTMMMGALALWTMLTMKKIVRYTLAVARMRMALHHHHLRRRRGKGKWNELFDRQNGH